MEKQVLLYISGKTSNGTNFMEVNSAVVIKFTDAFTLEPRNPVSRNLAYRYTAGSNNTIILHSDVTYNNKILETRQYQL